MPKPIRALLVATAVAASGCASDAVESELSTPSASASSAPAGPTVTIIGEAPVMTRDLLGGTAAYLLPSAFSFEGGMYHAWVVAFGEEPGDQRPIHLTSTDAITWEVANVDLLTELSVEYSRPGPIPSSFIATADDAWSMYLWGTEAPDADRPNIWRATAGDPLGPWAVDPEPALSRGPIEAWDGRSVEFPSVVAKDDGYLMVYDGSGFRGPSAGSFGVATSTDGVSWTKVADPVMTPGFCGEFDRAGLSQGRLLRIDDGGYLMPYGGHDGGDAGARIGLATSRDGMTWTCLSSEPILVAADIPDSGGIHSFAAALGADGRPLLLVESLVDDSAASEIWLATIDPLP